MKSITKTTMIIFMAFLMAFMPISNNNVIPSFGNTMNVVEAKSVKDTVKAEAIAAMSSAKSKKSKRSGKSATYVSKWHIIPSKCNITVCMNTDGEIDNMLHILDNICLISNTCEANKLIKKGNKLIEWKKVILSLFLTGNYKTLGAKITLVIAEGFSSNLCKTYNKATTAYKELKNYKSKYPTKGLKITFSNTNSKWKIEVQ